jgi:hypothetical protein
MGENETTGYHTARSTGKGPVCRKGPADNLLRTASADTCADRGGKRCVGPTLHRGGPLLEHVRGGRKCHGQQKSCTQ